MRRTRAVLRALRPERMTVVMLQKDWREPDQRSSDERVWQYTALAELLGLFLHTIFRSTVCLRCACTSLPAHMKKRS